MKTKECPGCSKLIYEVSKTCMSCWQRGEANPGYKGGLSFEKRVCRKCSKEFDISNYRLRSGRDGKYCSRECYFLLKTQLKKEVIKKVRKQRIPKVCTYCKVSFFVKGGNPGRFCSRKCISDSGFWRETGLKNKHTLPHPKGEDFWNWKGGITPANTKIRNSLAMREWSRKVKERDDFTCQLCGLRGVVLHSDHIKPFALYPELRFDLSNGRALCKPCHMKTPTYLNNSKIVRKVTNGS